MLYQAPGYAGAYGAEVVILQVRSTLHFLWSQETNHSQMTMMRIRSCGAGNQGGSLMLVDSHPREAVMI